MRDIMMIKDEIASTTAWSRNDKTNVGIASAPTAFRNDKAGCLVADSRLEHAGMTQKVEIASTVKLSRNDKVGGEIASSTAWSRNDKVGLEIASSTTSPRNDKAGLVLAMVLGVMMSVGGMGMAAETISGSTAAVKVELPTKVKDISGKVLARTRTNLSVETQIDGTSSMEYVVPFDRNTKLRGYRNFAEIRKGDHVSARLKQSYEVDQKGKDLIRGTIATQIALVKISTDGKLAS